MNIQFTPCVLQRFRIPMASYLSNVQTKPVNRQLFFELFRIQILDGHNPPELIIAPHLLERGATPSLGLLFRPPVHPVRKRNAKLCGSGTTVIFLSSFSFPLQTILVVNQVIVLRRPIIIERPFPGNRPAGQTGM